MMEIKGLDELEKGLDPKERLMMKRKILKYHGSELDRKMKRKASFTQGYQTGTTKRSISMEMVDALTLKVAPHTSYAAYLEHGTRFMSAQPFVQPALKEVEEQFIDDMSRLEKIK